MTWRWWRREDPGIIRLDQRNEHQKSEEAQRALRQAEQAFEEAKRRGAEVSKVSAMLRKLRYDNNFAALIEQSMRRRR